MAERARRNPLRALTAVREPLAVEPVSPRGRFSWIITRESLLRLVLSFVLAVALWLYLTGKQSQPVVYDYPHLLPVTFQGLSPEYIVNGDPVDVRIRVQLTNSDVLFNDSSFHPYVSLAGYTPGIYQRVPIVVSADPGIQVVDKSPATVPVRIELVKQATVPVSVKWAQRPPQGYQTSVSIQPNTVRVTGPASVVAQVKRAVVTLTFTRSNSLGGYTPELENRQGQLVVGHFAQESPNPQSVQVSVHVRAPVSSKTVPVIVPNLVGQPKSGFGVVGLTVSPSDVILEGPLDRLNATSSVQTGPLSIAHRGAGTFGRYVSLALPGGTRSATRYVKVKVTLAPVEASTSISVGITPQNLVPGLIALVRPQQVIATVVGPSTGVGDLATRLQASLDLAGYGAGTYYVTPRVIAPPHFRVTNIYPAQVGVTIQPASASR